MIHIALYQPEIAQNVGTIIRLCACFNFQVELIEPLGFVWSDKHLKRSGMDYLEKTQVNFHESFEAFANKFKTHRLIAVDCAGKDCVWDFTYQDSDVLLFGRESTGLPQDILNKINLSIQIPMAANTRSLNLAVSTAIVCGEVKRQII